MEQKANRAVTSPRGRPPSFDAETVVADALQVFCQCGYEATSLAELEQELGVNRSTLYNSFDGKEGLFRAAVDVYLDILEEGMFGPLREGTQGIEDLVSFTERLSLGLTDPTLPQGCLVVNAMVTHDAPEATAQYFQSFRDAIDAALQRAAELGEVSPLAQSAQTSTFLSSVLGANLAAKSGVPATELRELINGLGATVRSWSTSSGEVNAGSE